VNSPEYPELSSRTVNIDLGNLAEVNLVSINPIHITHIRLTGVARQDSRKMEIHLTSGLNVTVNFDEPDAATAAYTELVATVGQTNLAADG
jgi:hypothetical protein